MFALTPGATLRECGMGLKRVGQGGQG